MKKIIKKKPKFKPPNINLSEKIILKNDKKSLSLINNEYDRFGSNGYVYFLYSTTDEESKPTHVLKVLELVKESIITVGYLVNLLPNYIKKYYIFNIPHEPLKKLKGYHTDVYVYSGCSIRDIISNENGESCDLLLIIKCFLAMLEKIKIFYNENHYCLIQQDSHMDNFCFNGLDTITMVDIGGYKIIYNMYLLQNRNTFIINNKGLLK